MLLEKLFSWLNLLELRLCAALILRCNTSCRCHSINHRIDRLEDTETSPVTVVLGFYEVVNEVRKNGPIAISRCGPATLRARPFEWLQVFSRLNSSDRR